MPSEPGRSRDGLCWPTAWLILSALVWGQHSGLVQAQWDLSSAGSAIRRVAAQDVPLFNVTGSSSLDLRDVLIQDSTAPSLSVLQNQSFGQLLLLPWIGVVGPSATAVLQNVTVSTSCQVLRVIQQAACALPYSQLGLLHVAPGSVWVPTWADSQLSATNVKFTCPSAAESAPAQLVDGLLSRIPEAVMECAVGHAVDWWELADLTRTLQLSAKQVYIVLDRNISLPTNYSVATNGVIDMYRSVRVGLTPRLEERSIFLTLDYIRGEGVFRLVEGGTMQFQGITFTVLPLGPTFKFPMSLYPWGMWMVSMDRCKPPNGAITVVSCVLYTQPETMDYVSHWAGEFLSVFPDRAEIARWYGEDSTCNPTLNRTLFTQQMQLRDQLTWVARNASAFGVQFYDTTITSRYAGQLPPGLQLTKLFDDPYAPLNTMTWVSTPAEFVDALVSQKRPNVVLLSNLTIPPELWPSAPIRLQQNMVIVGWPARCTVLDWEGVSGVVALSNKTMKMRNIALMNGGQGGPKAVPKWASNLTMFQWPIVYDWTHLNSFLLHHVTIVVPPSEFAILRKKWQSMLAANSQDGPRGGGGLAWLQLSQFRNDSCVVPMLTEDGLLGYNVTITTKPIAYPLLNIEVTVSPDLTGSATTVTPRGGSSENEWRMVLAVVLAVLGAVATLLLSIAYVLWRRRQRQMREMDDARAAKGERGSKAASRGDSRDLEQGTFDDSGDTDSRSVGAYESGGGAGVATPVHSKMHISKSAEAYLSHQGRGSSPRELFIGEQGPHNRGQSEPEYPAPMMYARSGALLGASAGSSPMSTRHAALPPLPVLTHAHSDLLSAARTPMHAPFARLPSGRTISGPPANSMLSQYDGFTDSFDQVPQDNGQLLINRFDLSPDLQLAASAPDVAAQLKALVAQMQTELGDQEVTITRVIGHGGGGVVYEGTWRGLLVAVKSLVFTVLPSQPMSRRQQRAMTEAAICRTLQHPNIVATYSYDLQMLTSARPGPGLCQSGSQGHNSTGGGSNSRSSTTRTGQESQPCECLSHGAAEYKLYIIQEFCDGGTLKSIIDDGLLRVTTAEGSEEPLMGSILQLAIDIARGMCHVHSRNIVHGDLTPNNVLLKIDQRAESHFCAKIADFGLSWKLSSGQEHISNARQGTGFYISPEVLHVGIMSKPADVFSFGMVLHEMYHGTPIWRRGQTNLAEAAQVASRRPGLEQLSWSPTCPEPLRVLITACLNADPQARPNFNSITNKLRAMQTELYAQMGVDPAATGSSALSVDNVSASGRVSQPEGGASETNSGAVSASNTLNGATGSNEDMPLQATMRLLQGPDAAYLQTIQTWHAAAMHAHAQAPQPSQRQGAASAVLFGSRMHRTASLTQWQQDGAGVPPPAPAAPPLPPRRAVTTSFGGAAAAGDSGRTSPSQPQQSTPLSLMRTYISAGRQQSQDGLCDTPAWSLGKPSDPSSLLQSEGGLSAAPSMADSQPQHHLTLTPPQGHSSPMPSAGPSRASPAPGGGAAQGDGLVVAHADPNAITVDFQKELQGSPTPAARAASHGGQGARGRDAAASMGALRNARLMQDLPSDANMLVSAPLSSQSDEITPAGPGHDR